MTGVALEYQIVKGWHMTTNWYHYDTTIKGCAFKLLPIPSTCKEITHMDQDGVLSVAPGYLWDGSSGPTVDGPADPVPSLVHDVLYEAMRARKLGIDVRQRVDRLYADMLMTRGMPRWRAMMRYYALRVFGGFAASPKFGPRYPIRVAA